MLPPDIINSGFINLNKGNIMYLLTDAQVAKLFSVSKSTIWRYVRTKPNFPKPRKISPGVTRWHSDEIENWITNK